MTRFENKCDCGRMKVAGAIACGTCYAEAEQRRIKLVEWQATMARINAEANAFRAANPNYDGTE